MAKIKPDQLWDLFRFNLQSVRESAKLTQCGLAEKMGCTPGYICDLERGRRAPNLLTLAPLANALGVHPSALLAPREKNKKTA